MMFGHGANPILFNKKKIERPEHLLPRTPYGLFGSRKSLRSRYFNEKPFVTLSMVLVKT